MITEKIIVLNDTELIILKYAEKNPESFEKICDALERRKHANKKN